MAASGWIRSGRPRGRAQRNAATDAENDAAARAALRRARVSRRRRSRAARARSTRRSTPELQRTVAGHHRRANARVAADAHDAANVAVAVLDNRTGEWLAWEGSGDYFDTDHGGAIDGVVSPRQPGSALKPFTYAAAFERGIDPATCSPTCRRSFPPRRLGVLYSPRNYDGRFRGPLLARAALAGSENVPAVALASEIGVPSVARLLRRAGLDARAQRGALWTGAHAWATRKSARRAGRGLRDARARRRVAAAPR